MEPLDRLAEIAVGLHWVVTHDQLAEARMTKPAVRHAVASKRLFRIHPGVFVVGRGSLSKTGRWRAAVLACGDDALLSHLAAAALWEIYEDEVYRIDVTVPTQNGRHAPAGVILHRAETVFASMADERNAVPVTDLRRTLIDVAGILPPRGLRSVVRRAEQRHDLSLIDLHRSVLEPRRVAKYARLRRVLEEWVAKTNLTESDLEQEFLTFCAARRLPLPEPQVGFADGRFRADFTWPELQLIVETDGWRYHRGMAAGAADAAKDRRLKALGYEVLRFTWAEIINTPAATARELRAVFKRRRAELQSGK